MTQEHPITPSQEVVHQWAGYAKGYNIPGTVIEYIATQAARWGADKQLEMDATWVALQTSNQMSSKRLIAEMRPKPPSLKEQALKILEEEPKADDMRDLIVFDTDQVNIIRRALEQLND